MSKVHPARGSGQVAPCVSCLCPGSFPRGQYGKTQSVQPEMGFLLLCPNKEGKQGVTRAGSGMAAGLEDPGRPPVCHGHQCWYMGAFCSGILKPFPGRVLDLHGRKDTTLGRE